MKSFFKKLAFVMALAMMVSSVAPAAAGAAEKDVIIVEQTGTEKVEYIVFTEGGEAQDFRFLNAPANWRETYKWSTVDPTVATVDQGGIVTPVAKGQTKLQFSLEGEVVAEATILVNPVSEKDQFVPAQTGYKDITLTFAEATTLKWTDVKLYLVITNEANPTKPIYVPWTIVGGSEDADKNTVTVTVKEKFGNGDTFKVVAGSYDEKVTTVVAKPNKIVLEVVGKNEVQKDTEVKVKPTLYANDTINVTDLYLDEYEIKYTTTLTSLIENKNFSTNDYVVSEDGNYVLTAEMFEVGMCLTFQATLYDTKNKVDVTTSNTVGVSTVEAAPWAFDGKVVDWAIIKTGAAYVDWNVKTLPADVSPAGEYSIVLKFKDNSGKTYVTQQDATKEKIGNDIKVVNTYIDAKNKTDEITKAKYEVLFYSTNPDVMLVDEATGSLGVYTPEEITFYVGLNYYGGKEEVLRYVYAGDVEITEATRLDDIKVKENASFNILTAADSTEFLSEEVVTMEAYDQYDVAWNKVSYKAYYHDSQNKPVAIGTVAGNKITFTSADFAGFKDGTLTVTVEGTTTDVLGNNEKDTATVRINIVSPNYTDDNKTEIKLDQVVTNRYITYNDVLVEDSELKMESKTAVSGEIVLYKTSNGAKVDTYVKNDADGSFLAIGSQADLKAIADAGVAAEGTKYVVMYAPDGTIVPLSWNASGDKLVYTFTNTKKVEGVTGDMFDFAATGDYKVETVIVRFNQRNENPSHITKTAVVNVKNNFKEAKLDGWKTKVYVGKNCIDTNGNVDVKKVIIETVKFKDATVTANEIIDYKAVVLGENVIIQYVTLRVYNDAKTAYHEVTLKPEKVALKSDGTRVNAQ